MSDPQSSQIDGSTLLPLAEAILLPAFADSGLRTLLGLAGLAADAFAQGARYRLNPLQEDLRGFVRLHPPLPQVRTPDMYDPLTRRLHEDVIFAQEQFCTPLRSALASGRLHVAARKGDPTSGKVDLKAPLEAVDRKVWSFATPRLGIDFGIGAVRHVRVDARGPGLVLSDLHLLDIEPSRDQRHLAKARKALAALMENHDPAHPHTYSSTINFCRSAPYHCSEREARAAWKALPDKFKLLNRQGSQLIAGEY